MVKLTLSALLMLVACGGDAPASTDARSASVTANTDRRTLTPAQLTSRLPAEVDGRRASLGRVTETDGLTGVVVDYTDPADPDRSVTVSVRDLIDKPVELQIGRQRARGPAAQYDEGYDADHLENRVLDDGTLVQEIEHTENYGRLKASLFLVVGDRFTIHVTPGRPAEPSLDDLWSFYEASGFARLANAPVFADAEPAEMPAWTRDDAAPTPPPPAAVAALPACDTVLPLAEVERVCRVSGLRLVPNPFSDEGATGCNRKYAVPGNMSGLVFIVSRFSDTRTSLAAQRVTSDFDSPRDLRSVPGLGDAATRFVQELPEARMSTRVLSVAANTDLIELKSTVLPDESGAEVCTLDQMETLARGVVERLRD